MGQDNQLIWYITPVVVCVAILLIAIVLEFFAKKSQAIRNLAELLKSGAFLSPTILTIAIGVLLIIGGVQDFLFGPAFTLDTSTFHTVIKYGQIAVGACLVLGVFTRLMTLGIIALFISAFFIFPTLSVLDYSIFVGVSIFLFLIHKDALSFSFFFEPIGKKGFLDRYRKYALPILMFITGASITYSILHHTWLSGGKAVAYLNANPDLNIIRSIFGVSSFTNEHLVFNICAVGVLMGILLAFGLLERITAILIGTATIILLFVIGPNFLPIALPYIAVTYIVITGNQFEERIHKEIS
ncbi:hypothetical protein KKD70_00440 [Patescibacteria group bacterium]|nr:hypothetical protein [Patescibacteria group bacterium]